MKKRNKNCEDVIDSQAKNLADYIDTLILYKIVTGKEGKWGTPIEDLRKEIDDYRPNTGTIRQ